MDPLTRPATAFRGTTCFATGPLVDVALAVRAALLAQSEDPPLIFDDASGRVVDLDLRGGISDMLARLAKSVPGDAPRRAVAEPVAEADPDAAPRGRGRPKLGVVAREVTLLPRHWDWLNAQSGGASVALRRLVEMARAADGPKAAERRAREAAYRVMTALGGDLPLFEEAIRALFAGDHAALAAHLAGWPQDLRAYVLRLTPA